MKPSWLTDEQLQLRDMLHRLMADGPVSVEQLAELGVMGATIPEAYGGLGFGLAEATIIAEALGRGRSTAPFIETVILAGGLIAALGSEAQRQAWLPRIGDGTLTVALAFAEGMRLDPLAPVAMACDDGSGYILEPGKAPKRLEAVEGHGYVLEGTKTPVRFPESDLILVTACYENGLSLHMVETSALPASARFEMVDGVPAATIELEEFELAADTLLGPAGGAGPMLQQMLHQALVVQAAEQTGLMAHLINVTIDYLKQRKQFGTTLASFQVLQHRVADMMLAYEKAQSMVVKARLQGAALDRSTALGAAVLAGRGAQHVGHEAIQLHGGMGVTEELSVGPAVKRIYALETRLANVDRLARQFAVEAHA